jgi:uncharacterized membrane protein
MSWIIYVVGGLSFVPVISACLIKNKIIKGVLSFLSLFGFFPLTVLCVLFLPDIMGETGIWFAIVLCGATFIICMIFVWKPFTMKVRRVSALSIGGIVVLIILVFVGQKIYHNAIPQA